MAKEDISTSVDSETQTWSAASTPRAKPTPASGDKLVKQIDRFIVSSRTGKGN